MAVSALLEVADGVEVPEAQAAERFTFEGVVHVRQHRPIARDWIYRKKVKKVILID